jgi:hypothetical protein
MTPDPDEIELFPDWWFLLRNEGIEWGTDPNKEWEDRTPAERLSYEEGHVAQAQERAAAYDVLLQLHQFLRPEFYGGKPRRWRRKHALWNMLDHTVKVIDGAVYHHHESRYPEY